MDNKYQHNLSSYLELSPFVLVYSLLMHVIVLSFLLTLPMYGRANEKRSLWGHYVYLTGEKINKIEASTGLNVPEKQNKAAKGIKKAIIAGKITADVKDKEEMAPLAVPAEGTGNNDITMENITDEGPSIIKQDGLYTAGKFIDVIPSYIGPNDKETDKAKKTETASPVPADEHGPRNEEPAGPYIQPGAITTGIVQVEKKNVEKISGVDGRKNIDRPFDGPPPPSKNFVPVSETKNPPSVIGLSETGFSQTMEKAETFDKGESVMDQFAMTAQIMSVNKIVQDKKNVINTAEPEITDKVEKIAEAEEKPVLGLPIDESFFNRDIKIEVLTQNAESHGVYMYLLRNSYLTLRKRHAWGKENKIETIAETKRSNDAKNGMKTVFTVAKSDEGIYTFVIENRNTVPYNTGVVFTLYGGREKERIKKISAVSVPPSSMVRFMFVLPDTVFWDDEKFFTGSIEDSDSITKFNDETGFVWKEGKDH